MYNHKYKGLLYGLVVGDAFGLPYEFEEREYVKKHMTKQMIEYGSHEKPKGTWSDDTSMSLCLLYAMSKKNKSVNLKKFGNNLVNWAFYDKFTANNETFDVGITTFKAISNIAQSNKKVEDCGIISEFNGNGSVIRIPVISFITREIIHIEDRFELVKNISTTTHAHPNSYLSCFFLQEMLISLMDGDSKKESFEIAQDNLYLISRIENISDKELQPFKRLLSKLNLLYDLSEDYISAEGLAIPTLEASIWAFMNSNSYEDCILKAVGLGLDTDSVGAIAGSLGGLYYGYDDIPEEWLDSIINKKLIQQYLDKYLNA